MPDSRGITWLLKAEVDFQEIYNRIDRYSPERAETFYASVNHALDQLVLALNGRYGVFYRDENRGIVVLGIEDLRQDPRRIRQSLGFDD